MRKKFLVGLVVGLVACAAVSTDTQAAYNRANAVVFARKWTRDGKNAYKDIDWYTFSSDCTNFVSACEAYGGWVTSYIRDEKDMPKYNGAETVADTNTQYWYMVKRNTNNKNYWVYSSSWANVTAFRNYFAMSNRVGSNSISIVYTFSIRSNSEITYLCKNLKNGDVLQYDDGKNRHSVIISFEGINTETVKYCGHSNCRYNYPLKNFIEDCKKKGIKEVYVTHFR